MSVPSEKSSTISTSASDTPLGIRDFVDFLKSNTSIGDCIGYHKIEDSEWEAGINTAYDAFDLESSSADRDFAASLGGIFQEADSHPSWNLKKLTLVFEYANHQEQSSHERYAWTDPDQGIFVGVTFACGDYCDENYDASVKLHIEVNKTPEQISSLVEQAALDEIESLVQEFNQAALKVERGLKPRAIKELVLNKALNVMEQSSFLSRAIALASRQHMTNVVETIAGPDKPSKHASKM